MGRISDWKRKKLWSEQETGQVYTRLKNTNTTGKQLKQLPGEKTWDISHVSWATIPGKDR